VSAHNLRLPDRDQKPRQRGLTAAIDPGLPLGQFTDSVKSASDYVDFVKFGWGTALVTKDLSEKMEVLRSAGVGFYLGGTLFEKYLIQDKLSDFRALCLDLGVDHVEVSNGTIDLDDHAKAKYIEQLSADFHVISEVGSKDPELSEKMAPNKWIDYIQTDLNAGAVLVTLESRESGQGGICRPEGGLRIGLIEEILTSGIDPFRLMFEAPLIDLQAYFVRRVGPNVNLGNVPMAQLISVETIRLGLRSDTLLDFETGGLTESTVS
jgi:phosphosulfolactate synthase